MPHREALGGPGTGLKVDQWVIRVPAVAQLPGILVYYRCRAIELVGNIIHTPHINNNIRVGF